MENSFEITIEPHRLKDLHARIKKLNKIAEKNGLEKPTVEFGEVYRTEKTFRWVNEGESETSTSIIDVVDVKINMLETYKMNGYSYRATVFFREGFVDQRDINWELPKGLGLDYAACDHCNGTHHSRVSSVIFQNEETKNHVQVGTKCAGDFFGRGFKGLQALEVLLAETLDLGYGGEEDYREYSNAESEERLKHLLSRRIINLEMVFATAEAVLDKADNVYVKKLWDERWEGNRQVSYRTNEGEATIEIVEDAIGSKKGLYRTKSKQMLEAMEYAGSLEVPTIGRWDEELNTEVEVEDKDSFAFKLRQVAQTYQDKARYSDIWKVIWIIIKYRAYLSDLERAKENVHLSHVGIVGEKTDVNFIVTDYVTGEGQFGTWELWKGMDENGNLINKFGTMADKFIVEKKSEGDYIGVGDTLRFKAMVKKHDTYRDVPVTILGRLSMPSKN